MFQVVPLPTVKLIEVIELTFERGKGTEKDPKYYVKQYCDKNGNVLAENVGIPKWEIENAKS